MTRALWALGCLALVGCAQREARTQIMLEVAVESSVLDDLRVLELTVHVSSDAGAHWRKRVDERFDADDVGGAWSDFDWPARLGVVPADDGDAAIVYVRAAALDAEDRVLVAQSAAAAFVRGRTKRLRIELLASCKPYAGECDDAKCIGSSCSTCRKGNCVDVGLADDLPDYEPSGTGIIGSDEDRSDAASPEEDGGGSPAEDSGGSPAEDSGGSPAEDSGGSPAEDSGGSPAEDSGGSPAEDSGGSPTEDSDAAPVCGDGVRQGAEVCDDGSNNGQREHCDRTCAFECAGNCPLRVDLGAPPGGDGLSWQTAMREPQAAVNQASAQGGQVWLKRGTYQPTVGSDSTVVLTIPTPQQGRLEIYGGFAGDEASLAQRDPGIYDTVLSGASIARHVVWGSGDYLLDGVTIIDGRASPGPDPTNYEGGGMYNTGGSPTIRNCAFFDNQAWGAGGAIYNEAAYPLIEHCRFENNEAIDNLGGAIYSEGANGTVRIRDSVFADNNADSSSGSIIDLGAHCEEPTCGLQLELEAVRFEMNRTRAIGLHKTSLIATDVEFISNNTAWEGGGVLHFDEFSSAVLLRGAIIASESNGHSFGATISNAGRLQISDSRIEGNQNPGGILYNAAAAAALIVNTRVQADTLPLDPAIGSSPGITNQGTLEVVNCSFDGTLVDVIAANGPTRVINSALWPGRITGSVPATVEHSCLDNASEHASATNVELDASPFDQDGLLLPGAGDACLNAGDAQAAEEQQIPWQQLTTQASGCLDSGAIDIGVHLPAPDDAVPCL